MGAQVAECMGTQVAALHFPKTAGTLDLYRVANHTESQSAWVH